MRPDGACKSYLISHFGTSRMASHSGHRSDRGNPDAVAASFRTILVPTMLILITSACRPGPPPATPPTTPDPSIQPSAPASPTDSQPGESPPAATPPPPSDALPVAPPANLDDVRLGLQLVVSGLDVPLDAKATIGQVGNMDYGKVSLGKAGRKRWLGIRPTVRGVAMNPVDHPMGGGEGRSSGGGHPMSPWGQLAKGKRTRCKRKPSGKFISKRRKK